MRYPSVKPISRCLLLLAGSACLGTGLAAEERQAFRPDEWVAVSDEQLDTQRGGFDAGSGLAVSFGIIRTVMVNGDLVSKTSFNLPDVTKITSEQARLASAAIADSGLVQIGPNNFVDTGVSSSLATGTLIQNSLNDQQIQTLTIINTGVNSLVLLKALNTQTVLNDALLGAVGNR
ncbi:MAG: hypothetical protein GZ093_10830 [Rhodoferax sp.]|uniref:hypothetical protein n=1 Tax=Rhodoferax sp. TaxID=50421 RepID=UPI0014014BF5|nr:hypothetical protein [Rhodoferax sp.]NDP39226.1 hypothetical protein [Rhodoferax sp.]